MAIEHFIQDSHGNISSHPGSIDQDYLNHVTSAIELHCVQCAETPFPEIADFLRGRVNLMLDELQEKWSKYGVINAPPFIDALKSACHDCNLAGRPRGELDARFSCGIRIRTPERPYYP